MKPLKILFADDDLKYSLLLKRFLEKEGYDVTYVGNGGMAIEQFPLVKPDLVLLDINMPVLNGFEVATRIRQTDKHVLIFFLSDRSDKADRLQGFQLRANDYLAKPFYPEELIARIRERFSLQLEETVEEETYRFGGTVFCYNTNELRTTNSKVLITSRQADILIAAIGHPGFVKADMVKEGAVVVDVGIHRVEDPSKKNGFHLCGDVDYVNVAPKCSAITPVPGGVGPMTIAGLLMNTMKAYRKHTAKK